MTVARRLVALLVSVAWAAPAAASAPDIGRLFLTPEARTALERQRRAELQPSSPQPTAGMPLRLDGVVVRSSGASTVWINRRPQTGKAAGVAVTASSRQPGKASVAAGEAPAVDLKVGTILNPTTGEQRDGLAGGVIRVRPARQP
jgi:hypothetical protein